MSEIHEKNEKNKPTDGKLAGMYFTFVYLHIDRTRSGSKQRVSGQDPALLLLRTFFNKTLKCIAMFFPATIESLLDSFKNDKDEGVRSTVESSLIRIADKRPNELLNILCDFKTNHQQKIDVNINACVLR